MAYLWTDVSADQAATPELHLVGAILQQAVKDAQSPRQDVREDALAFWANPRSLQYWESFLGLRDGVLQQRIRHVLQGGR